MSMDKGSRLVGLLQNLEKLGGSRSKSTVSLEDLQQTRHTTTKILQCIQSPEKCHRDLVIKNSHYLDVLFTTLEYSEDLCVEQNIVYIISELIGKTPNPDGSYDDYGVQYKADSNKVHKFSDMKDSGKRLSALVEHGATQILLQTLVFEARELKEAEELLVLIHQVLAKLGPKDRKFALKARLSQALPVTLSLVRSFQNNPKLLLPVVHVLKICSTNTVNASYLGKNGAITYLFKVLSSCGRKQPTLVKYALDSLVQLVKSKSNSARAVGQGGVPLLVHIFHEWNRADSKNKHVSLRKAILTVLKHITNIKSGRKALMEADGFQVLYNVCQESSDCRELDSIVFMASVIMRKCIPKNRLPLENLQSAVTCPLPNSNFHVIDTGEGDENGYESSIDNDDDISSDDEPDVGKVESEDDVDLENRHGVSKLRSWEDLLQYQQFFPELYEFDALLDDDMGGLSLTNPIIIPTGLTWESSRLQQDSHPQACQSERPFHHSAARKTSGSVNKNRHSLPNLYSEYSCVSGDSLVSSICDLKVSSDMRYTDSDVSSESGASPGYPPLKDSTSDDYQPDAVQSTSAINLKTGSSIFSLDLPRENTSNGSYRRDPQKRKHMRSAKQSARQREDPKRTRHRGKTEDSISLDSNLLSITPINSALDKMSEIIYSKEDYISTREEQENQMSVDPTVYASFASKTKSIGRFNKMAYPDLCGSTPPTYKEPFHEKRFGVQRSKIFEDIDRFINPELIIDRVVYDLDAIVNTAGSTYTGSYSNLSNNDEAAVNSRCEEVPECLSFNAQFESGNLRKAIQIRRYEYDLILNPDVNTNHHHQWFYFEVSGMEAGVKYRFNLVNCEKVNSQFNFGMRPVMYSVAEALQGRPYWFRIGSEICYYKNHFMRSAQATGGVRGKSYFTTTFIITFKHANDVCYLAYHYPYTYSTLQSYLFKLETTCDSNKIYFKNQVFCYSLLGNPITVLTITSHPHSYDSDGILKMKSRPYIFLSSRVHPGESNASWVMKGSIDFLLGNSKTAQQLRDMYIFKIVPMLNPDGVINGNHRCSLVAEDLNRQWLNPCPQLHPTIYHCKGLLQFLHNVSKAPLVYCDYHGHSRKKNVFMYGCSPTMSWMEDDFKNPSMSACRVEDTGYKTLPRVLQSIAPSFSYNNCCYMVEKSKESTARVVVWREVGVVRSYTMESTFCGCDQGPYRGQHISTRELEEMGKNFCEGLLKVRSRHTAGLALPSDGSSVTSTSNLASYRGQQELMTMLEGATASASSSKSNKSLSQSNSSDDNSADSDNEE